MVFNSLREYANKKYDQSTWQAWLRGANISVYHMYLPGMAYPDAEIVAILQSASRLQAKDLVAVLDEFGRFIAPELLGYFPRLVDKQWKTLDLIENTEHIIHTVVRREILGAEPPELVAERLSPTMVLIKYTSHRKLCPFLKGIVHGLADHYHEEITMHEETCMLKDDPACHIRVEQV
jgi:hypothetical protein